MTIQDIPDSPAEFAERLADCINGDGDDEFAIVFSEAGTLAEFLEQRIAIRDIQIRQDRCTGCGAENCCRFWLEQQKCCPDCSHEWPAAVVQVLQAIENAAIRACATNERLSPALMRSEVFKQTLDLIRIQVNRRSAESQTDPPDPRRT